MFSLRAFVPIFYGHILAGEEYPGEPEGEEHQEDYTEEYSEEYSEEDTEEYREEYQGEGEEYPIGRVEKCKNIRNLIGYCFFDGF